MWRKKGWGSAYGPSGIRFGGGAAQVKGARRRRPVAPGRVGHKLANGKRKRCDIIRRIRTPIVHDQACSVTSTDRTGLRRRHADAGDDALAVASARRTAAVAEDAGSLCPRRPP